MATSSRTKDYLAFMKILKEKVLEYGLLGAYQDPAWFAGVPHWTKRSCLKSETIHSGLQPAIKTVTADDILHAAVGINTYWQSGMATDEPLFERGSDAHVASGSLWARILQKLKAKMGAACSQDNELGGGEACSHPTKRRLTQKARDPRAAVADPLPWSTIEPPPDSHCSAFQTASATRPARCEWENSSIKRRCSLIRNLGEGTYGKVFIGKYTGEVDTVAVKVSKGQHLHKPISPTEVALLTRLPSHENVVRVRDYFFSPYFSVLVLQEMDTDLWQGLCTHSENGGLQPGVATHVAGLVARGAAHVHDHAIIHRDLHAGNILISFAGGLRAAVDGGLQPAGIVARVCIADFGQGCDVHGSKSLEERSVGVGARNITPPEMYLAGSSRGKASYDSAVDVWAIGLNLFLMIAGYQKLGTFTRSTRVSDYLDFWAGIIGKVPAAVAARMGWAVESRVARGDGLQPAGRAAPLEPVAANRVGRSMPRAEISMCSLHKTILIYDPSQRPVARGVQRRCEDLTQVAAIA